MIDRLSSQNTERGQALLAQIERYEKKTPVTAERLAEIQAEIELIPESRARADSLLTVASQLAAIDQKASLKFLDRAREVIDTLKPGKDQTQAQLGLAMVYCQQKSERGFAIMESLLPKLNELVEIAVKLDGYDTNYIRDGEWNMSANGSIGEILTYLSNRAGDFAWFDFDRAVSLASQFERPEIRMMAHLKLAQSVLSGPQRPEGRFRVYTNY